MNDLVKFFGKEVTPVANREKLADALRGLSTAIRGGMGGRSLLRLTKQGTWEYGADSTPLDTSTPLVVNPNTFQTGWIAWNRGEIEAEIMRPVTEGPVDFRSLPEVKSKNGWQAQLSVELATYEDDPIHLVYKTNSRGGITALQKMIAEVAFALSNDDEKAYPITVVGTDSYTHKEWGLVYVPTFDITGWLRADGTEINKVRKSLV